MINTFNNYFKKQIEEVADILKKLDITPEDETLKEKDLKEIATNIVEIEVLFTAIHYINNDFLTEMKKLNIDAKPLVKKVSNIKDLLYLNRPPHWEYLSFEGKVCNARLFKWFLKYASNTYLIDRIYAYFDISKQLRIASNRKVSLLPLVTNERYLYMMNTVVREKILSLPLFEVGGCKLDILENYELPIEVSNPRNRYETYKTMLIEKFSQESMFATEEKEAIKKIVLGKNEDGKNKNGKKKTTKFKVKTSKGEFDVDSEFEEIIIDNYKEFIKKLEGIKNVKTRDKALIKVTLDELEAAAKILDEKIGEDRFINVLNTMDFIDPKTQSRKTTIEFDGLCNMLGMVNAGKTTFMVVVAVALVKKGYKVGLVLRDNDDVFQQYKTLLNNVENINAVPVIGKSNKKAQAGKVLSQNIDDTSDSIDIDIFKDTLYEFVSYSCPLKSTLIDNPDKNRDVFKDLNDNEALLCNNFYCNEKRIACPFTYKCSAVASNEIISEGNVFLTNSYSFTQTNINKYFIEGERRISEFLYDVCDLVMFDESDIVQFIGDSSFVNNSSVYNDTNRPSIIEKIDSYLEKTQGNVTNYVDSVELLHSLSITRMNAHHLLKKLCANLVPSSMVKGPIKSKSVYGFLSWLLIQDVSCVKSIAEHTVNLNLDDVKDFSDENYSINNENYKLLIDEFKRIESYIYAEYRDEFNDRTPFSLNDGISLYDEEKYEIFSNYLNKLINQQGKDNSKLKEQCLEHIFNTNLCNSSVVEIARENDTIKTMILDILSFALVLTRLETDLMQITTNSASIISKLYRISNENIEDIPSVKPYIKDYKDVLTKCPLDLSMGLQYNKEQKSLNSIIWSNVGREHIYNYPDLWKYVRGDKNSGVNITLLSGTSYMPTSPLYHIEKPVNYIIRTKKEEDIKIKFVFAPEKDDEGNYIYNSGINKSINNNRYVIYKNFAKAFCSPFKKCPTKLDFYLNEYTKPGRERILISVGTYEHALILANYIYEALEYVSDSSVNVACLIRDNENNISDNLSLPSENRLRRQSIKNIEDTPFNIVVVPQTALQRGINMVGFDTSSDITGGKKVASFSCILKTNRDYQIPNSNEYAVARVNHKLNKLLNKATENMDSSYDLNKFVKNTIGSLNRIYDEYYITKYFADLSEEEREMIIADLCVEDFQFIGRIIRGDSDACVIMADAAFFRSYTKDGTRDTEKTSTIVAIKWLMERLKEKSEEDAFIINELYSPFLNGMYEMLDDITKS